MDIKFIGFEKIDWFYKRRILKITYKWLEDHINALDETEVQRVLNNINQFKIIIMPTSLAAKMYAEKFRSRYTGKLSDNIPHEVVGFYEIHLFLPDRKDDLMFASNIMALTHALGHALLFSYDSKRRVRLTVDDASGNRKGDELNWHTAAVHNRTEAIEKTVQKTDDLELDNQIYYLQTYRFIKNLWKKTKYRVYDFRDDLQ